MPGHIQRHLTSWLLGSEWSCYQNRDSSMSGQAQKINARYICVTYPWLLWTEIDQARRSGIWIRELTVWSPILFAHSLQSQKQVRNFRGLEDKSSGKMIYISPSGCMVYSLPPSILSPSPTVPTAFIESNFTTGKSIFLNPVGTSLWFVRKMLIECNSCQHFTIAIFTTYQQVNCIETNLSFLGRWNPTITPRLPFARPFSRSIFFSNITCAPTLRSNWGGAVNGTNKEHIFQWEQYCYHMQSCSKSKWNIASISSHLGNASTELSLSH